MLISNPAGLGSYHLTPRAELRSCPKLGSHFLAGDTLGLIILWDRALSPQPRVGIGLDPRVFLGHSV